MLRCKLLLLFITLSIGGPLYAQELFVFSEPASNMPAKSIGIRMSNWLMEGGRSNSSPVYYHFLPEIMWGANKRLMLHLEGYFSNVSGTFKPEGAGVYAKYRFYSNDKVFYHFRLAAFARASTNNSSVQQEEIATNGYNTGYQLGIICTQLLHKTALSATVNYERALDNMGSGHEFPAPFSANAVNYSLSAGRLLLPKNYTGYKQTNVNIMLELLGQSLPEKGKQFLDVAGSVQFIFNSQTRVDIGYKYQIYSDMQRFTPNGALLRVEHLLYNIL